MALHRINLSTLSSAVGLALITLAMTGYPLGFPSGFMACFLLTTTINASLHLEYTPEPEPSSASESVPSASEFIYPEVVEAVPLAPADHED